ncbi:carbohydrate ABC transporter permease [Kineosporia sp. R_H_3]|uniref:carbohydrate ABC transporter permease n=1 Tax=Kineosporia sp. R_H_3 TaxID=1961848 RepID=UPI000B4B5F69|nr:carbohydrate ABC transporter permease [Kineosporia sp. R_H_3]
MTRVRTGSVLARGGVYASLVLATVVVVLPIAIVVLGAFKTDQEYLTSQPLDPPADWSNVSNFVTAFRDGEMVSGFLNTAVVLALAVTGTVLIGAGAAYAIDRFRFAGRSAVLVAFLVATLVPGVTTQVATFQIINGLGLYNTIWAGVLLFAGTDIVSIYIFWQFMRSIPRALDEAATLDGAGHLRIFFRIILPNLKPAIATVVIIKGIAIYNEFYIPYLYMPDHKTIATSLFAFKGPFGSQWEVICAGIVIILVPTLVAFLALQRWIYNGFTSGATK